MNRLIYALAGLAMLCLTACGGDDAEPTPPTPPTPEVPTAFEYNHTPLNDYLVEFAGNTDRKSTEEVLSLCADNYNAKRKSLIGTPLDFLSSMRFTMDPAFEGGWVYFRPVETPYLNDIPIMMLVLVEMSDDEVKKYSAMDYGTQFELSGKLHDFSISFTLESVTDKTHMDYSFALDDAVVKTR